MSRPRIALILLALWVASTLAALLWPLLYLLRGREVAYFSDRGRSFQRDRRRRFSVIVDDQPEMPSTFV